MTSRAPARDRQQPPRPGVEPTWIPKARISSLDTSRGLLLVVNVVGLAVLAPVPGFLTHAEWIGVTVWDTIFPLFVTFSGVGLAFAYRQHVGWRRTLRRSLVLLVVGLLYTVLIEGTADPATLQIYAVLVLVVGLLHLALRTWRPWAVIALVTALGQAVLLTRWQAGCPGDVLTPACNPSRSVDFTVFTRAHVYAGGQLGHDPEGLVALLGAFVTTSVGVTAGHLALAYRGSWQAAAGVGRAGGSGRGRGERAPARDEAAVDHAAGARRRRRGRVAVLAIGIAVMDLPWSRQHDGPGRPRRSWWERVRGPLGWPLVAMGRNSLLVYFGSHLVMHLLLEQVDGTPRARQLAEVLAVAGHPRVTFAVFMLACWLLLTGVLHHRRIYLRP